MNRVLVTGASGFVGRALCDLLARSGYQVRAALRVEGAAWETFGFGEVEWVFV